MTTQHHIARWLWSDYQRTSAVRAPIGEVLRQHRIGQGLTQAEGAEMLHIDQSYVSRIESGRRVVRDVGLLLHMADRLEIPPRQLGLSDELAEALDARTAAPALTRRANAVQQQAVEASQEEWRQTRRYLNKHRFTLARHALRLYGDELRVGATTLIASPDWMPKRPVELTDIALSWVDGLQLPPVSGAEPEAQRVCPLQAPGRLYDRYTSAMRYIDPPLLFENRPSYRLLDVSWHDNAGVMSFGIATYFDKLDVSEAVGHEHAALLAQARPGQQDLGAWAGLPLRALIGDPFDCRRRAVNPAIITLTIRRNHSGSAAFLLHWRDPARVATAGGMYDVIPAGEFQPSSVAFWDQRNDFNLWRNIVRELSEELLGAPEHDGSRSSSIDYESWRLYRDLRHARLEGRLKVCCLGVGLDALTLAATILTVIVIDEDVFSEVFGDVVRQNSEGCTVSVGPHAPPAEGVPFTQENIRRLLSEEPMASPGAACLSEAWRHRRHLLHS